MVLAVGSKYELSYVAESTYGTTPSTPTMLKTRITGDTLDLSKETFLSNELRSDREVTDFRHGNRQAGGALNFELSFDTTFEDFFLALLGASSWSNAATKTGTTIAFVNSNPDTITDSGNGFVTAGFEAGDVITVSGATNGGNNSTFTIATVVAGTITLTGAASLTAESAGASVTITAARKFAKIGTAIKSFSAERRFTDAGVYSVVTGIRINTMSLSVQPNAIVTGSFGIFGKDFTSSTSTLDASPTEPGSNAPFDSFTGTIEENGSSIALVTGVELNVNNNLDPAFVVGSATVAQIFEQRCNVSGTLTMFLQDEVLLQKFKNETVSSLELKLSDGTNFYKFIVPRLKYGAASAPVSNFGGVTISMPFQAYRDPTVGASLRIEKSS